MTAPEVGSESWLRWVFDLAVPDAIFPSRPEGEPVLVLLGGQPAAGKTHAQDAILTERPELVSITGDDLRRYHPDYGRLVREDPLGMPAATAPASGGLIRIALDHAREYRYPVLLESTFRDPAMMADTATRYAEAGYRVEVVVVGTPAPVSRLGAEQRYLAAAAPFAARWTPPEAHETALKYSPDVVVALEALPAVAHIQVHSREHLLYDNTRTPDGTWAHPPQAADVLRAEQKRALSPADAAQWLARYRAVFDLARERTGYLSPATIPAYRALQADAAPLIDIAAADPAADIDALREEQRRRDTALRFIAIERAPGLFGRLRNRTIRRGLPEPPAPPHHGPRNEPPSLGL